jgi:hypothetical protein
MNDGERRGELIIAGVAGLGRAMRDTGAHVTPSQIRDAVQALGCVSLRDRDQVYWALRCTLASRHEDLEAFDDAFRRLVKQAIGADGMDLNPGANPKPPTPSPPTAEPPAAPTQDRPLGETDLDGPEEEDPEDVEAGIRWSAVERLRTLDFAAYTDVELQRAGRLMQRIARAVPLRRSRRYRSAPAGRAVDTRRTLRAAMRTGGYPLARQWRTPRLKPRRLVFVVDVSGSMQPYARAMIMFLQAAVRTGRPIEAFTLGTRLTRVTRELQARDPDRALRAATRRVPDWAGGTRIGENLRALNERWGRMGMTRGAVVVIVSDGWERGELASLVTEMERLQRAAHTVVWVNPLAGEPGYEPLAQGMAASLPYIDRFLPGHNLRSFEALAEVFEELPGAAPAPMAPAAPAATAPSRRVIRSSDRR